MIGKIKEFNFKSLLILNTFALIITSYFLVILFSWFIFIFVISLFTTKNGLKIIQKLSLFQNIRSDGPVTHFKNDTTMGGIFIVVPFLIFLLIINTYLGFKTKFVVFTIFGFFITGFLDDYLSVKNKKNTGLKSKENLFYKVQSQ